MTNQEFIEFIAPMVQKENEKRGNRLFSSVVIAQAILETGWGKSVLMMKTKGIFGIKATPSWKGKVYSSSTREYYNGYVTVKDTFRAYDTYEESISDYFNLILNNERYHNALDKDNANDCIVGIYSGGYATDPSYIRLVMGIITTNNLTKYDKKSDVNHYDIDALAYKVINGEYGNGEERKAKLGILYNRVQNRVNELLSERHKSKILDINELARKVINGEYGNGEERKAKLGLLYDEVQNRVNEMLK